MSKIQMGKEAEEAVCLYLSWNGCEILHKNYHTRWGELDLIGVEDGYVIGFEVRSSSQAEIFGQELINGSKLRRARVALQDWTLKNPSLSKFPRRLDFISVKISGKNYEIERWEHI